MIKGSDELFGTRYSGGIVQEHASLEGRIEGGPSGEPAAVARCSYGGPLECIGSARDAEPDDGSDNEVASGGKRSRLCCQTPLATARDAKDDATEGSLCNPKGRATVMCSEEFARRARAKSLRRSATRRATVTYSEEIAGRARAKSQRRSATRRATVAGEEEFS